MVFSDGWAAEFAQRITMPSSGAIMDRNLRPQRAPGRGQSVLRHDTVFADGYAWNTLSPDDKYVPDRAAIAAKAAIGLWALWETSYTDKLFEAVSGLYTDSGFYEGLYETGNGVIPLQTANNNGIILAALLYKAQGPIFRNLICPQLGSRGARTMPTRSAFPLPPPGAPLSAAAGPVLPPPPVSMRRSYCTTPSPKVDRARLATMPTSR